MQIITKDIPIASIQVGKRLRPLDKDHVEALAVDIVKRGQLDAIWVRDTGDGYKLLAGRHRLAAMQANGDSVIRADVWPRAKDRAVAEYEDRQAEIVENLMRKELCAGQRDHQLAELELASLHEVNQVAKPKTHGGHNKNEVISRVGAETGKSKSTLNNSLLRGRAILEGAELAGIPAGKIAAKIRTDRDGEQFRKAITVAVNKNNPEFVETITNAKKVAVEEVIAGMAVPEAANIVLEKCGATSREKDHNIKWADGLRTALKALRTAYDGAAKSDLLAEKTELRKMLAMVEAQEARIRAHIKSARVKVTKASPAPISTGTARKNEDRALLAKSKGKIEKIVKRKARTAMNGKTENSC